MKLYCPIDQAPAATPASCAAYLTKTDGLGDRHQGGVNVMYVDTHVHYLLKSVVMNPESAANHPVDLWGHWSL